MKIGLTICEYNPFHNGHLYSLTQIKKQLNPDLTVVIMSGNFTQRGETAIMHKYARAKHAVLAGADVVFELPTVFATAPAEIFAKGAVKLLSSLKGEKTLCFGVENLDKSGLIATATALSSESEEYKSTVKNLLNEGYSLAKAKHLALEQTNGECSLFTSSPNNILAVEYTKAIIQNGYQMDILPILRVGAGYKDTANDQEFSSAMGVRDLVSKGQTEKCKRLLPDYVYQDLPCSIPNCDENIMFSLICNDKKDLAKIIDCTEGLENRIKCALKDCFDREELIKEVSTKRYPATRISRITLSSLLGISHSLINSCLNSNLYLKVLAVNKDKVDSLSKIAGKTPLLMRKSDCDKLRANAKKCFAVDVKANDLYNQATKTKTNEYYTQIIKK